MKYRNIFPSFVKSKKIKWVLLGLLILAVLLPNSPQFRKSPTEDSGIFLYIGEQIRKGNIPYRDVWDHKGPVIYYINALGLEIGNGSAWGVWFLEFVFIFFASIIGFVLIKRVFGVIPALFASFLWVVSLILVLDGGNLTEEYNILFQFLVLSLFLRSESQKSYGARGFLIGAVGALSFLLRQNLVGILISIIIFILATRIIKRRLGNAIQDIGVILAGFAVTIFTVFFYFAINNSLDLMLDEFFGFNFVYSFSTLFSRLKAVFMGLWILARSGLSFVVLTAWIMGSVYFKRYRKMPLLTLVLIGLPVELLLASISGIHPPHYYMAWLPVFAVLAAFFAYLLVENMRSHKLSKIFLLALISAMSILPAGILFYEFVPEPNVKICQDIGWFLLPSSRFFECTNTKVKAGEYVRLHTERNDYVLMWGFGGSVNFTTSRRSPTRFAYQYPLFLPGYASRKMANELYEEIILNKPKLVIDTTPSYFGVPPIDKLEREKWTGGIILPEMNKIFQYFSSNYQFVESVGQDNWLVYRYIGQR